MANKGYTTKQMAHASKWFKIRTFSTVLLRNKQPVFAKIYFYCLKYNDNLKQHKWEDFNDYYMYTTTKVMIICIHGRQCVPYQLRTPITARNLEYQHTLQKSSYKNHREHFSEKKPYNCMGILLHTLITLLRVPYVGTNQHYKASTAEMA